MPAWIVNLDALCLALRDHGVSDRQSNSVRFSIHARVPKRYVLSPLFCSVFQRVQCQIGESKGRRKPTWFRPRRPIAIVTSWWKDGNVDCREWKRSKKWLRDDETIDLRQQRMMYHIIGLCHARFSCHHWAPLPQSLHKSTSCSTTRCQMHRNPTGIHIPELSFARKLPERSTCFKPNVQTHPE